MAFLRRRRSATAHDLAVHLEVSERTVYRDVRDLVQSGVPIRGEAGVGYRLERSAELPPVMFDLDEIQALVFGARMVDRFADPPLRAAARSAIDKIAAVLPAAQGAWLDKTALFAPPRMVPQHGIDRLGPLRTAVMARRVVQLRYEAREGAATERTVCPLGLWFWGQSWTLASWCELREGYRNFRVDRITELTVQERTFPDASPYTVADFVAAVREAPALDDGPLSS